MWFVQFADFVPTQNLKWNGICKLRSGFYFKPLTFFQSTSLSRKSHTGERNYACEICGKRFLYSYNVTAHIKHVHRKEKRKIDEEKLTCKFCGKRFQKIWKVKEHMAEVHQLVEIVEGAEEDRKYQGISNHPEKLEPL